MADNFRQAVEKILTQALIIDCEPLDETLNKICEAHKAEVSKVAEGMLLDGYVTREELEDWIKKELGR